jgi:hypothetical protein
MPVPLPNDSRNMAQALSTTLYAIHTLSYLPNLRRVTVDFFNWEFDDIFDSYRLLTVPNQVTELELNYAYSKCTPSWLLGAWRSTQNRHGRLSWSMSSIRTLSIFGAGETFVAEVASICPNLKTLVMDVHTPLADILNLPSSAKTNSSCISPAHVGVEVRGHQSRDYLPHIWDTSSSAPRTILS